MGGALAPGSFGAPNAGTCGGGRADCGSDKYEAFVSANLLASMKEQDSST